MTNHIGAAVQVRAVKDTWLQQAVMAIFVLITALLLALPSTAGAQEYKFNSIKVDGNQRIESAAILNYAGIETGKVVTAGQINGAYQRILDSGLFETVELTPRGSRLDIKVVEYPTINRISIEGNERLKDDALLSAIESQPRKVLNPTVAERDAAFIAEAYSQSGRLAARVTPRIIRRSDNRADLVFEIFEGGISEVERISFVGNQHYSDRRLRRVLGSKQAGLLRALIKKDTYVADRVEFDKQLLRDFYLSRGYVDFRTTGVNAELSRERDGYFLTFNLQEGQQFRFGEISVVSEIDAIDAVEYMEALKIKPGVVYSPTLIENSIARLERLALRHGHDFVRVDPRVTRNERELSLDVEFAVVRGPRIFVERIDVEGNTATLDRVIRHQFRSVEGDPFNPREIRESAERIRALGFFETAEVNAREGSSPDQVVVDVDVVEQPTGSLKFGGTFSTDHGIGLVIEFAERNFLGRGQYLSLSLATASELEDYSFTFIEPAFLGRDLAAGLEFRFQEQEPDEARWVTRIGEIKPTLAFPVSEFGRLELRYTGTNNKMTVGSGQSIPGSLIDNEAARGDIWKSSLGYTYGYDTRFKGLDPNRGVLLEFSQDFGGLGGDYEFVATSARAVAETRVLQEEVRLFATFEGGALYSPNDDSRVTDRYFLSSKQLRGFEPLGVGPREYQAGVQDDALGGKYFAVARFEAQFPLGLPEEYGVNGGFFYDVGSVWGLDQNSGVGTVFYEDLSWRHVIGFSIFWETPVGPLRFNFTKALKKEALDRERNFDFTISAQF
ncbi:Beta-barrel assembly machine subunit BamA [Shimia gijangensis]|uniref:Outer membrane protein assembly factor BamA n=1 Tax=Shimia gijangensis TaxID=1470563 RepID=A0A1M6HVB5_9RHOB|nr:outer membrane protein assembly factor BamA [Shimia gijangensis]SHJ26064.1 Beta-barrel assembly machine subunit BamA [Shimia gijangensis]